MPTETKIDLDTIVRHYLIAALWSEIDDDGNPLDDRFCVDDVAPETVAQARLECQAFIDAAGPDLVNAMMAHYQDSGMSHHPDAGSASACFGHDFLLTRNGHGAGFWDRGAGETGDALAEICRRFLEVYFYVGDDGRVYSD